MNGLMAPESYLYELTRDSSAAGDNVYFARFSGDFIPCID